jgi:hypothetical protein
MSLGDTYGIFATLLRRFREPNLTRIVQASPLILSEFDLNFFGFEKFIDSMKLLG